MEEQMVHRLSRLLLHLVLSCLLILSSSGCNASAIQAYINLAVQIALQIAQLAGASKSAADKVAVDLASVDKLINDYNAADATAKPGLYNQVDELLTVAQYDLSNIFVLASIKDAKTQNVIHAALAIGVTAIESIRALALKKVGPTVAGRVVYTITLGTKDGPKIQSPAQLKELYNLTVADYPTAQLH
jgi:hypothetical protein